MLCKNSWHWILPFIRRSGGCSFPFSSKAYDSSKADFRLNDFFGAEARADQCRLEDEIFERSISLSPRDKLNLFLRCCKAGQTSLSRLLLWRVEGWIYHLAIDDLITLFRTCIQYNIRDFEPGADDVFSKFTEALRERLPDMTLPQINQATKVVGDARIRSLPYITESSFHVLRHLRSRQSNLHENSILVFLTSLGKIHMAHHESMKGIFDLLLEANVIPQCQSLLSLAQFLQLLVKFDMETTSSSFLLAVIKRITDDLEYLLARQRDLPSYDTSQNSLKDDPITLEKADTPSTCIAVCQLILPLTFRLNQHRKEKEMLLVKLIDTIAAFPEKILGEGWEDRKLTLTQLKTLELIIRLEMPMVFIRLSPEARDLLGKIQMLPFVSTEVDTSVSKQHLQVSAVLKQLNAQHSMEKPIEIYVCDIALDNNIIIEIDGPFHFVNQSTTEFHAKTILKHRLLSKLGYVVYHIAYFDWPVNQRNQILAIRRLLQEKNFQGTTEISHYERQFEDLCKSEESSVI